ncbi:hypothetical protein [Mucilaginibacter myungsuensis]|uniref:Lipoprotein n=1 Tax=Mucilaginibacter myungsuensis TaxID=649104 RepID=A0A929L200_9SPHI|nr:hypothetical protein [Mucilaginibacter myungsuensis]MBE9664678.1 hypothetical protein [Mucilaginibacter myungsuensis]MDN3601465.1 hypothetical protein [Mucilaginibacter myungsuensis]
MRYLTLLIIAFSLTACHSKPGPKDKWLQDTLAELRKKADFKPLPLHEAYDFINKYYLPKLDSLPIHRTIFVHPLTGKDFQLVFKNDSALLGSKHF